MKIVPYRKTNELRPVSNMLTANTDMSVFTAAIYLK